MEADDHCVSLLREDVLREINAVVVRCGHERFNRIPRPGGLSGHGNMRLSMRLRAGARVASGPTKFPEVRTFGGAHVAKVEALTWPCVANW